MKIRDWLATRAVTLCFLLMGGILGCVFLFVGGVGVEMIAMAAGFFLLLVALWLAVGYVTGRRRLRRLDGLINTIEEPYLLGEMLPRPFGAVEQQYFEAMKTVSRSAIGAVEQAVREREDYCDYVESWIHEIKTPLTACSLILSNDADPRKLRRELKRADNLTESILYYARLRTAERDLQIKQVSVAQVMDEAVKSEMELLIAAGISVEAAGDFPVHTDAKPLCFILKQLLINCAKYCPGCHVEMAADNGRITVRDNGPGIPAHELVRVKQRGFTGTNGKRTGGSTGMGLYIVDQLCGRLGMAFSVESEEGAYTCAILSFDSLTKT